MKYNPYWGYGRKPFYWIERTRGRVRTRSGWRWFTVPAWEQDWHSHYCRFRGACEAFCRKCGKVHCSRCWCYTPWKRWDNTGGHGSVYEKRFVHRHFRHDAKRAIQQELAGDDSVSHAFRYSGDWLD